MKPNPLIAAVFAIILLLTLVVLLRSVIGAPESHTEPNAEEESHETDAKEGESDEMHIEEGTEESSIPQEEPAH